MFYNVGNVFRRKERVAIMVRKVMKLSVLVLCAGLVVGCASKGDIANLQTQIDDLKVQTSAAAMAAEQAAAKAASAEAKAASAESIAYGAEATANETSSKLDRMFKKSMSK